MTKNKSIKVYHFRDKKYGIKSIGERRLKISRIMELNDPFELLGVELSDKQLRKAFNDFKRSLNEDKGLLCFSKYWDNPVQWTHYADRHRGICMEFTVPESFLIPVKYTMTRIKPPKSFNEHNMLDILSTKFIHWEYEKEYRVFVQLDKRTSEKGLYFFDFSDKLRLTKVIVGALSSISRKDLDDALGELSTKVICFKVRPAFKTFKVVRNRDEKLWK